MHNQMFYKQENTFVSNKNSAKEISECLMDANSENILTDSENDHANDDGKAMNETCKDEKLTLIVPLRDKKVKRLFK